MPGGLPLIVLGGQDRRAGSLPPGVREDDVLGGFKGLAPLPNGRVLIGELIERYRRSGCFGETLLIGPARAYADAGLDCEIIDRDGELADTLRTTLQLLQHRFGGDTPVALTACDVVPAVSEIRQLLASCYDPDAGYAFWGQLVAARPDEMGASRWKPSYRLALRPGGERLNLYPGHLIVVRAAALKSEVIVELARLAYRYRNRPLMRRVPGMLVRGATSLGCYDLSQLLRARASASALGVPWQFLRSLWLYRRGAFSVAQFERSFDRAFVRAAWRAHGHDAAVRFAVCELRSFAKDIDTRAEFDEFVRSLA